jgi:hypothetical protein
MHRVSETGTQRTGHRNILFKTLVEVIVGPNLHHYGPV